MPRRIVDLSVMLEDKPTQPARHRPEITYVGHDESWAAVEQLLPGVPPEAFLEGKAWAVEQVSLNTHSGTHMDAPWHYHPTMNHAVKEGGEPAATIDQVPLDWCIRPGVKLDFRHFPAGYTVTAEDIAAELDRIGHELAPLEIVLVNTRAGTLHDRQDYWQSNCGVGREATLFLLERGIRVVGTDAWGWDIPFSHMIEAHRESGGARGIWEGHKAGAEIGYYQMEKLCNLEALPPAGFTVLCLPIKIKGASAAWTRAVAIIDD